MEYKEKRLIDMTLQELTDFLDAREGTAKERQEQRFKERLAEGKVSVTEYDKEELIVGVNNLAAYLGVSVPTALSMKYRGEFEGMYFHPSPRKFFFISTGHFID